MEVMQDRGVSTSKMEGHAQRIRRGDGATGADPVYPKLLDFWQVVRRCIGVMYRHGSADTPKIGLLLKYPRPKTFHFCFMVVDLGNDEHLINVSLLFSKRDAHTLFPFGSWQRWYQCHPCATPQPSHRVSLPPLRCWSTKCCESGLLFEVELYLSAGQPPDAPALHVSRGAVSLPLALAAARGHCEVWFHQRAGSLWRYCDRTLCRGGVDCLLCGDGAGCAPFDP